MQTTEVKFNSRIHRRLQEGGAKNVAFTRLKRHPLVLKRFHLMTPLAMKKLNSDPSLLCRLEEHFETDPQLSDELIGALEAKGLCVKSILPDCRLFYTVSGTSGKEFWAMTRLRDDMKDNPIVEDMEVLFLAAKGIELVVSCEELSQYQLMTLKYLCDPQTLTLSLMKPRGIKKIVITEQDFTGVAVEKDGEKMLFISRADLNGWKGDLSFRIIDSF